MKRTFYEKRGRRYYPVAWYDSDLFSALPQGSHLITVEPGRQSCRYHINPDHAPLLAALEQHREVLVKVLMEASSFKLQRRTLTKKETRACAAWEDIMGKGAMITLKRPSAQELLDILTERLIAYAAKK